jgi:hypothetical protein
MSDGHAQIEREKERGECAEIVMMSADLFDWSQSPFSNLTLPTRFAKEV